MDSEYIMYILVNKTVKMDTGKIASQVGHGVQLCFKDMILNHPKILGNYEKNNTPKIVKKINTLEQLNDVLKLSNLKYIVKDAGRTQVEPNTLTVISFLPIKRCDTPDAITVLKLL